MPGSSPERIRDLRRQETVDGRIALVSCGQVLPRDGVQLDAGDPHVIVLVAHERDFRHGAARQLALQADGIAPGAGVPALDRDDVHSLAERRREAQRGARGLEHAAGERVRQIGVEGQAGVQGRHEQR